MKSDFWEDSQKAQEIMAKLSDLKSQKESFTKFERELSDFDDYIQLIEMSDKEEDEFLEMTAKAIAKTQKEMNSFKIKLQLDGQYDTNNVYMTIHAGAGGLEATDWAEMLLRMYQRFFDRKGYKYEVTDLNNEEAGGIKSVTMHVKHRYAYGYLKGEKGVHRLVRISPFDSSKRRHTSFASVDIFPEIEDNSDIEIDPKDLRIDTFRASGAGGQHVNMTDSAVRITHLPTGVSVSCQSERSQIQNRQTAMNMLYAKLVQIREEEQREKIEDIQGKYTQIAWGNQIRSYVFHPYTMVKDHRTQQECGDVEKVMNGNIDDFIEAYLNAN